MKKHNKIPDEIYEHYKVCDEKNRLSKVKGILELERSKQIVSKYLKEKPMRILDVGGGTGIYAKWLGELGHKVDLVDPMPNLIEVAKSNDVNNIIEEIIVGDVRSLPRSENYYDLILCFGPFYHLTERGDRDLALAEMLRVLKPKGNVLIAGIGKYVSLIQSGFHDGMIEDPVFKKIVERDIEDGQHRNPLDSNTYFTTSIFMEAKELRKEVKKSGFKKVKCMAVEGPGWLHKDLDEIVHDKPRLEELMNWIKRIESRKSLMALSTHFIVKGKKGQ